MSTEAYRGEGMDLGSGDQMSEVPLEITSEERPRDDDSPVDLAKFAVLHRSMIEELKQLAHINQIEHLLLGFEDANVLAPASPSNEIQRTYKSLREIFDVLLGIAKNGTSSIPIR